MAVQPADAVSSDGWGSAGALSRREAVTVRRPLMTRSRV